MESSKTVPYIPPEIIVTQVLPRLPVQSLLRFKCVCKSWLSLISSSQFAKTHLKFSKTSPNYANHRLILGSYQKDSAPVFSCSLTSILDKTAPLDPKPLYLKDSCRILCHCNGVLLLYVSTALVLFNPSTRKSKNLPASQTKTSMKYIEYGICYNESSDDYKVVELTTRSISKVVNTEVKIYSLRTNSWRKIEGGIRGCVGSRHGLSLGGVVYWDSSRHIFSVDTETYTHGTLEPPDYDGASGFAFWGIVDLCGCLGVYHEFYKTRVEIWTMMNESWTKVLTIPYCARVMGYGGPLLGLKDGEILIHNQELYLMVYNSRENSFLYRVIYDLSFSNFLRSPVYIESLVEPRFDGE